MIVLKMTQLVAILENDRHNLLNLFIAYPYETL